MDAIAQLIRLRENFNSRSISHADGIYGIMQHNIKHLSGINANAKGFTHGQP